jgi:hypothetical protein
MRVNTWVKSEIGYGEELVRSAMAGVQSAGHKALGEEPVRLVLKRSARTSLPWAAAGACIGVMVACRGRRLRPTPNAAVFGLLGAIVGFGANMAISTRQLTGETFRGAMRNVTTARDAHWLAKHPINYA